MGAGAERRLGGPPRHPVPGLEVGTLVTTQQDGRSVLNVRTTIADALLPVAGRPAAGGLSTVHTLVRTFCGTRSPEGSG